MSSENSDDVRKQLGAQSKSRIAYPKKGDIALDLGVGTAASTATLAKSAAVVIGIDKERRRLEEASQTIDLSELTFRLMTEEEFIQEKIMETDKVILIEMDARNIAESFGENFFDFIDCYAAFHHFYEQSKRKTSERLITPIEILKQIHYVLKPQGKFTLFDPVFSTITRDVWEDLIAIRENIHPEGDGQFYTEEEFLTMFKEAGLIVKDMKKGTFPRALNKWIRGGIDVSSEPENPEEKDLKKQVVNVFEKSELIRQELMVEKREDGWWFNYNTVDILAQKV